MLFDRPAGTDDKAKLSSSYGIGRVDLNHILCIFIEVQQFDFVPWQHIFLSLDEHFSVQANNPNYK